MPPGNRRSTARSNGSVAHLPNSSMQTPSNGQSVSLPNLATGTPSNGQSDPPLPNSSTGTPVGTSGTHSSAASTATTTTRAPRAPRGLAKNNLLTKHIKSTGLKPRIEIKPRMLRPVGAWSTEFTTEVGIICRMYAPLTIRDWRLVRKPQRHRFHCRIKEKFDIDLHLPHVEKAVNHYLGQRFKDYRCRLHHHYQQFSSPERARANPYRDVGEVAWNEVCTMFETKDFQDASKRNKANRQKLKVNHNNGSKSFARLREELRDKETQQELGRLELYRITHSKGDKWTSPIAEKNYNDMVELQSQPVPEGGTPMTEDEICDKILGTRPGYVKGLGHGVLPSSSSSCNTSDAAAEAIKRAEEAEKQNQELKAQLHEQNTQLQEQNTHIKNLLAWQATMQAQFASMTSFSNTPS